VRTVSFIRPSFSLGLLIAALSQGGAISHDMVPSGRALIQSPPFAPARPITLTLAPAIAQPQDGATLPNVIRGTAMGATSALASRPPHVLSFKLLPQSSGRTAELNIEFSKDARLAREFALQLDNSRVILRLTSDNVATTRIELDTDTFLKEQAARAELARRGALSPIFRERHFEGFEQVRFLDQEQLRTAIRLRRSIDVPFGAFDGIPGIIDPSRELMITDLNVVEDKSRTFDVCKPDVGTKMGAWTFGRLLTDISNRMIEPAELVQRWLELWLNDQTVNSFKVPARAAGMQNLLLNWPRLDGGRLNLSEAPMRLLAIVNRLDLRQNAAYGGEAGEARFVFAVIDRNNCQSSPPLFTVILEYGVPRSGCTAIRDWAQQWHNLGSLALGTKAFNDALQKITDEFARPNAAANNPNGSALNQLRTNEAALDGRWELREFHLDRTSHRFLSAPVVQTPDLRFNLTYILNDYLDTAEAAILARTHNVPHFFRQAPFLGGNAPNDSMFFWNSLAPARSNQARHLFSRATCNGCHSRETDTQFTHINPRLAGFDSKLSKFLIGDGSLAKPSVHAVTDPVHPTQMWYHGDLVRRQQDLAALLGSSCTAGGFLPTIAFRPLNTPH
jgi:hypothetical protein